MDTLTRLIVEAGLLQFGRFQRGDDVQPLQTHLEMLASYPDVLRYAAERAVALLTDIPCDRLLCTRDAVPFGVAVGLQTNLPLVSSQGDPSAIVDDLVGAYDIGHQTALLTTATAHSTDLTALISGARRVGLAVSSVIAIISIDDGALPESVEEQPLLRMTQILDDLVSSGDLPAGHAQTVRQWLARRRAAY
ncbi:MAG: hypothetical protein GYB67_08760 [Chloroflexi bacterium]|nr:hypothetical protein [Chloroflexota bacterium]